MSPWSRLGVQKDGARPHAVACERAPLKLAAVLKLATSSGLPPSSGESPVTVQHYGTGDPDTVFESASAPNESTTATSYQ